HAIRNDAVHNDVGHARDHQFVRPFDPAGRARQRKLFESPRGTDDATKHPPRSHRVVRGDSLVDVIERPHRGAKPANLHLVHFASISSISSSGTKSPASASAIAFLISSTIQRRWATYCSSASLMR